MDEDGDIVDAFGIYFENKEKLVFGIWVNEGGRYRKDVIFIEMENIGRGVGFGWG